MERRNSAKARFRKGQGTFVSDDNDKHTRGTRFIPSDPVEMAQGRLKNCRAAWLQSSRPTSRDTAALWGTTKKGHMLV